MLALIKGLRVLADCMPQYTICISCARPTHCRFDHLTIARLVHVTNILYEKQKTFLKLPKIFKIPHYIVLGWEGGELTFCACPALELTKQRRPS